MRTIDADALKRKVQRLATQAWKMKVKASVETILNQFIDDIDHAPTVEVVPVKHGRWIKKRYWSEGVGMGERYGYYYSCSKCGNWVRGGYDECGKKYCDECGALMDGKDGDGNG